MRAVAMALVVLGLIGCGSSDGGDAEIPIEQASGTPLPETSDQSAIDRIAATLSSEGEYSDRKMFTDYMFGKKLKESGALTTSDPTRYSETTVEAAIASERAGQSRRDGDAKSFEQRRAGGDLQIAREDCDEMKRGFEGSPMTYPNGYDFGGETYPDPCAALSAAE
ncbi:hypothetical protein [Parerythrobacter lacustris]|uniref:Excinuclease ABC subunit B n=1 Tax=Parerythrobacter lacustris TaxID=2969984 RepID=A0ABT1XNY6_9SPHN|nr:hypothetical protein [Parerythrobacter lacustris]MCR2833373.1 hypothetical protein [Parerythrobacter lacustris]